MKMTTLTFLIFIVMSFIDINLAWRFLGSCLFIVGIITVCKKSIFLGVEDQPSIFQVKGMFAVLIGLLILIVGMFVMINPDFLHSMFGLCEGLCEKTLR